MGFLYKLVDKTEIEFANKGQISLSHPIFEFIGSEGKFINFAKDIYDDYVNDGKNIKPTQKNLKEIKEWIEAYKSTFGKGWSDEDIISESKIIFCGIMQGFCGYYTTIDLFDSENLKSYLKKNKLKDKIGVLQLDDSVFKHPHWKTYDLKDAFNSIECDSDDLEGYNGFTHLTDIIYNAHSEDYNELLEIYNRDETRNASIWFNNLPKNYEWQQEKRIIFLLRS